jgi:Zn-dependent protease with chaperone function
MKSQFKKTILFFYLILATSGAILGQHLAYDYHPVRNLKPSDQMIEAYMQRYSDWGNSNAITDSKVRATFKKFIDQKTQFLTALDSMDMLIYGDSMTDLVERIKNIIIAGNENLKDTEIKIFVYRNNEANAFSLGEGLILVSTGLLARMPDVAQVAFVLSHEIAHDALNHVFLNLLRISERLHDGQMKKTFQKANRKKEGRNTAINNVLNNFIAVQMAYSQRNEFEADSMGLVCFQHAGFSAAGAVSALGVLDSADYLMFKDTLDLRHYFNFEGYPFKSYWLDTENSALQWERDTILFVIPDSLKSHPDCDIRIQRIRNLSSPDGEQRIDVADETLVMEKLKDVFQFESLEAQLMSKDYVMALYMSLQLQTHYPDNIYLKSVTTHALLELAAAFSRNEFLEYVEFADMNYPSGYNQILTFLHNMNSTTLYKLATYCLRDKLAQVPDHAYIGFLNTLNDHKDVITEEVVHLYAQQYKDEYFTGLLRGKAISPSPAGRK